MALPFFGIGMKIDLFSSPVATAEFSKFAGILSAALSQHHFSMMEHGSGWSMDLLEHGSGKGI